MDFTLEQKLRVVLMKAVEKEAMSLVVAQCVQDAVFADCLKWVVWDADAADRLIGPLGSGKLFGGLFEEPLNEGTGLGRWSGSWNEPKETLSSVGGAGLGPGNAQEAATAAGHVGLSS